MSFRQAEYFHNGNFLSQINITSTIDQVEKPQDVTFDTITPDTLRAEKGLLKVPFHYDEGFIEASN